MKILKFIYSRLFYRKIAGCWKVHNMNIAFSIKQKGGKFEFPHTSSLCNSAKIITTINKSQIHVTKWKRFDQERKYY
jgi:hypothetical protein